MEANLMVKSARLDEAIGQEDEPLLAAALAALLVEVGRHISESEVPEGLGTQTHWRMMGRWEQLRG